MAFRLWYRTPGLLRLRVLRDRHQGSELLLDAKGVLRRKFIGPVDWSRPEMIEYLQKL